MNGIDAKNKLVSFLNVAFYTRYTFISRRLYGFDVYQNQEENGINSLKLIGYINIRRDKKDISNFILSFLRHNKPQLPLIKFKINPDTEQLEFISYTLLDG